MRKNWVTNRQLFSIPHSAMICVSKNSRRWATSLFQWFVVGGKGTNKSRKSYTVCGIIYGYLIEKEELSPPLRMFYKHKCWIPNPTTAPTADSNINLTIYLTASTILVYHAARRWLGNYRRPFLIIFICYLIKNYTQRYCYAGFYFCRTFCSSDGLNSIVKDVLVWVPMYL